MKYLERFLEGAFPEQKNHTDFPTHEPTELTEGLSSVLSVPESRHMGKILLQTEQADDSPIKPGWVVAFLGTTGQIQGGRVKTAQRQGSIWIFTLEDGQRLPEGKIRSVARVEGGVGMAAWSVKEHGLFHIGGNSNDYLSYHRAAAGANPIAFLELLRFDNTGKMTTGIVPLARIGTTGTTTLTSVPAGNIQLASVNPGFGDVDFVISATMENSSGNLAHSGACINTQRVGRQRTVGYFSDVSGVANTSALASNGAVAGKNNDGSTRNLTFYWIAIGR